MTPEESWGDLHEVFEQESAWEQVEAWEVIRRAKVLKTSTAWQQRNREMLNARRRRTPVIIEARCVVCLAPVSSTWKHQKFCSKPCRRVDEARRLKLKRSAAP